MSGKSAFAEGTATLLLGLRRLVKLNPDNSCHTVEIGVAGKDGGLLPPGDGGDHAVDQPSWGYAGLPAPPVDSHGTVEVDGCVEMAEMESQQETAQIGLAGIAAGTREHFHDYWFGVGDRPLGRDEF